MEIFHSEFSTNHFSWFHLTDTHEGSGNHNEVKFLKDIEHIKQTAKDRTVMVTLGGDLIECIAVDDKRFSPAEIDDKYRIRDLKDLPKKQADFVLEKLDPIIPYIKYAIIGNHEEQYIRQHHFDVYDYYCHEIGCQKLGGFAIGRISMKCGNSPGLSIDAGLAHGKGGGNFKTPGYALTYAKERFQKFDLDVSFIGHIHRLQVHAFPTIKLDKSLGMKKHFRYYCLGGCYLETYGIGNAGYFEGKPGELSELGMVELRADRYKTGWRWNVKEHDEEHDEELSEDELLEKID